MVTREVVTFTVVCDSCGSKHESVAEWLEHDPCMPDRID